MTTSNGDDESAVEAVLPLLLLLLPPEPFVTWRWNFRVSLLQELPDRDLADTATPILPDDNENDLRSDLGFSRFSRSALLLGIFEILVVMLSLLSSKP